MKRKRLNRDAWGFQFFPYYQTRIDSEDFHGFASLIKIVSGEYQYWEMPKTGRVAVCGEGMTWLQFIPDNTHRLVTVKYFDEDAVDPMRVNYPSWAREAMCPSVWYVDVIEKLEYDEDGMAIYVDKYLDVIFSPEGDVTVDDRPELDEAYQKGELTRAQYEDALAEGEAILKGLCEDIPATAKWSAKIRREVEKQIADGLEPVFMKWTNEMIKQIAMHQSAEDANCKWEDFVRKENVITISKENPNARKYLKLPHVCNLISYGNNIVATISEEYREIVEGFISKYAPEHCFETPNMHVLDDAFEKYGYRVCFMAEYFLLDLEMIPDLPCEYEMKVLVQEDFKDLYLPEWSNALCFDRKQLDVLGVGAYDDGKLIALAACSADCFTMWQIGVDVLPEYRRKGIASALTSRLAKEILKRGKVPFYCCAWSNVKSARNAIKSGFRPAWVEMTVKSESFVDEMNGQESKEKEE